MRYAAVRLDHAPHGPPRGVSWRRAALLALAVIAALLALGLGRAADANAAPCPAGLTVVGLALTGADCIDVGNGEIEIDTPRLLTNQVVEIRGKMVLDVAKTKLRQKTTGVPLVAAVANSAGVYSPFMLGSYEVGNFEVCDLFRPGQVNTGGSSGDQGLQIDNEPVTTNDRFNIEGVAVNCQIIPALNVTQPALQGALKLLKLGVKIDTIFRTENGVGVALPTTFGLDEQRGGRVTGNFSAEVPLPGDAFPLRLGITAELSRNEGFKPVSLAAQYIGSWTLLPGVKIVSPSIVIDPANNRYGGGIGLRFPPKLLAGRAELIVQDGQIQLISFDVGLPPPGIPVGVPPVITFQSFGLTFQRGTSSTRAALGAITSPAKFQGRTSFTAGPIVPTPVGSFSALVGDVEVTVSGPTVALRGTLTGINKLITLGQAFVLVGTSPFRFEAGARVAFPSTTAPVIDGQVFIGATATAFTGLGTVVMQIPPQIPVIGGQKLGGFSAVVSNKAVAGTIFIDPPVVKPRNIGAAFVYGGGFTLIDSVTPFITVTPTQSLGRSLAGVRSTFGAGGATFLVPPGSGDIVAIVKGASGKPTNVTITGPDGKTVTTTPFPSSEPAVLQLAIAKPKAGNYTVKGNGIAEVTAATLDNPGYLDPREGYGTRPRPPITAGTPVPVCWDIENAPAGAVVDLFEDTNGFAATGRDIAVDLPASGCFDIPTTDWEPGKHWAYGIVRVGDNPLNIRYWPIGIVVVDPNRAGAPTGVKAKRTKDGATITWKSVADADGYVVIATAANPQDAPQHKTVVNKTDKPSVELSLRGAASWKIVVQSVGGDGALGNISKEITTGALEPVVLAGTPNGTPQVGEAWAFDLDLQNVKTLKLLSSPKGTKLNRKTGLLTWTPSAKAGTVPPQTLRIQGCSADKRCVTQEWQLTAFARGTSPVGPSRGFLVLDSVVEPGETIELRAQGIDEKVTVKIDGKTVKATVLDQNTVAIVLPKNLAKGAHDVSFRIGQDLEETRSGAIVVL